MAGIQTILERLLVPDNAVIQQVRRNALMLAGYSFPAREAILLATDGRTA